MTPGGSQRPAAERYPQLTVCQRAAVQHSAEAAGQCVHGATLGHTDIVLASVGAGAPACTMVQ